MSNIDISNRELTRMQIFTLTFLRVLIGWHFLYEGLTKLYSPGGWTSELFLANALGPFSAVFKSMASNHTMLAVVDQANIWCLILIGLGLFAGIFAKKFALLGVALLFLYYIAYPPFSGYPVTATVEGSYWIVNKNLIELAALLVLYSFPSSHITGIDKYLVKVKKIEENSINNLNIK